MKSLERLIAEQLERDIAARPPWIEERAWLQSLRHPDSIPYDPAAVRIKRDRIKLPDIGWLSAPGLKPGMRPTAVSITRTGEEWAVEITLDDGAPDDAPAGAAALTDVPTV